MNKLILFGASKLGKAAYTVLKDSYEIVNFTDNNKTKWGKEFCNVPVISPAKIKELTNVKVIITSMHYQEIADQLMNMGINDFLNFFYFIEREKYHRSYSQEGEDMILRSLLTTDNKLEEKGFFVDIGAYHPVEFSNSFYFYKLGWSGINIEPRRGSKELFDRARPRDLNLEIGISNENREWNYFVFDEPALNTIDEEVALRQQKNTKYNILRTDKIISKRLVSILDEYAVDKEISFINIDVEGHELNVLKSNDWAKYRPEVLTVEMHNNINDIKQTDVYKYLNKLGYRLSAKTPKTAFFKRIE